MGSISLNNDFDSVLSIDIDKYIDWYKVECENSEFQRWLNFELMMLNKLRSQTNYSCGTYKNEEVAYRFNKSINKKYSEKVKQINNLSQAIYYENEWLVPTYEEWETFDKCIKNNEHINELKRLLSLCKDTQEAKSKVVTNFIEKLKNEKIKNIESIKNGSVIPLDFFDKNLYYAQENPEYMGYCKEGAFFSLIYDYLKIKAIEYANELLNNSNTKKANINLVPIDPLLSRQSIEIILEDINGFLFDNSTIDQWESVFNQKKLNYPIKTLSKVTLKDIRYFFDGLVKAEVIKKPYAKKITTLEAIEHKNKLLTLRNLKDAFQDMKKPFSSVKFEEKIDEVIKKLL